MQAVPDDFLFAVKASRYLTHMKKLKDPAEPLETFLKAAELFSDRLGPLLYQLPPRWKQNLERLEAFIQLLPGDKRHVFEFRDHSRHTRECLELLKEYNAAFCIYELAGFETDKDVTADFVYIRLHGPDGAYQGDYSLKTLQGRAGAVSTWTSKGLDVFCFFDNDQSGFAAKNAAQLQRMLSPRSDYILPQQHLRPFGLSGEDIAPEIQPIPPLCSSLCSLHLHKENKSKGGFYGCC